ncbi:MAG TPA: hypothetical protein PLK29_00070 [Chiayiivirga sp.]|nr:hypothetical protein [Chiayiivirga sp.]
MRWLWFVASLLCFAVVFKTTSIALALLCLLGALVFMVVGTLALAAQRIDSSRGDLGRLIGPEEIRRMREAEARRKADAGAGEAAIVGVATVGAMLAAEAAGRDADAPQDGSADEAGDASS